MAEYMLFYYFLCNIGANDRIAACFFSENNHITDPSFYSDYAGRSELNDTIGWNTVHHSMTGSFGSYRHALIGGRMMAETMGDIGNAKHLIILTTDKDTSYDTQYYMSEITAGGFDVTVALVEYRDQTSTNAHGQAFADYVGGEFFNYGTYGTSIWEEFINSHDNLIEDWSDNDGDGVADFIEEQGIQLSNGSVIHTSTSTVLGDDSLPIGYDTDGDTVSDGEELGTMYTIERFSSNPQDVIITPNDNSAEMVRSNLPWFIPDSVGKTYVFAYKSDPTLTDTDGDWADDSIDVNPLVYHYGTIDLGGGSFELSDGSSGYIHVYNAPQTNSVSYGGSQTWFGNLTIGNGTINTFIDVSGCGIIASNDVMLYLTNGVSEYHWNDYYNSVIYTYNGFSGITIPGTVSIAFNSSSAISPLFVQLFFLGNGYTTKLQTVNSSNKDYLLQSIRQSLRANRPIILMENDPLVSMGIVSVDESCHMYKFLTESNSFDNYDDFNYHYVTVTGLYEDDIIGKVYLRVQSWGDIYYVEYNEFCDYNTSNNTCKGEMLFIN